jgi:hypothetical protein
MKMSGGQDSMESNMKELKKGKCLHSGHTRIEEKLTDKPSSMCLVMVGVKD